MESDRTSPPCVLVIFGASGDLAHRKLLPALYNLHVDGLLPAQSGVVGIGRREMTDDAYRDFAREGIDRPTFLFCLDLYKYFDIDSIVANAAPTKIKNVE